MEERQRALGLAIKLLARREHSRMEMAHKLGARRFDDALIEQVLDECETQGWLDNQRFAEVYGRGRMEAGYGPLRIRAELEQRGVQEMPACLAGMEEQDWQTQCLKLYQRRFDQAGAGDWNERARRMRFLQRRGFARSHIEYALKIANQEPESTGG